MHAENEANSIRNSSEHSSPGASPTSTLLDGILGADCHVEMIQRGAWMHLVGWVDSPSTKTHILNALPSDDGILRVVDCVRVVN